MESFGARLKREREKRKITLDDISVATKIAPRFLVALESDQYGRRIVVGDSADLVRVPVPLHYDLLRS